MSYIPPYEIEIEINGSKHSIVCEPTETILEACLKANIEMNFSCKTGACGTCRAKLLSGQVKSEDQGSLTEDETKEGIILCCQSKCSGDMTVKLKLIDDAA